MIQQRREKVLIALQAQLKSNKRPIKIDGKTTLEKEPLEAKDKKRIEEQIKILSDRLLGIRKVKTQPIKESKTDTFVIDIYSIVYGYAKRSERRRNKGGSSKKIKMSKTKRISFVKTVKNQIGLLLKYKEGKMGLSPKGHKFVMRDEHVQAYPSI